MEEGKAGFSLQRVSACPSGCSPAGFECRCYACPTCGGHFSSAPVRRRNGSCLSSGGGPSSPGTGPNVGQSLRAQSASLNRRDRGGFRAGTQELIQFMLKGQDSFLDIGGIAELLRRKMCN